MALLSVIRRWHFREELSIREICRRTGLSRNTIRKYLRLDGVEPRFKVPERPSKLDPFADRLSAWLKTESKKNRKQKRTMKQLHADLMLGVYYGWNVSAYLIDAIIGLSVVYKALDNLGAFQRWLGFQPNTRLATLIFGFFHGLGLATKILEYDIAEDGLIPNLLAFNVGVEIGQLIALAIILIAMSYWRKTSGFLRHAYTANVLMMTAGWLLVGYQLTGYFVS